MPLGFWWNRILTTTPNALSGETSGALVAPASENIDVPAGTFPDVEIAWLPVACQHCDDAPCVKVCPVGATFRRDDGTVLIDFERCIGCRYCVAACPYGVRTFNWGEGEHVPDFTVGYGRDYRTDDRLVFTPDRPVGIVKKCTFCVERIDVGGSPTASRSARPARGSSATSTTRPARSDWCRRTARHNCRRTWGPIRGSSTCPSSTKGTCDGDRRRFITSTAATRPRSAPGRLDRPPGLLMLWGLGAWISS